MVRPAGRDVEDFMNRVCAWCDRKMGEKEPLEDKRVTSGMCPECAWTLQRIEIFDAADDPEPARSRR